MDYKYKEMCEVISEEIFQEAIKNHSIRVYTDSFPNIIDYVDSNGKWLFRYNKNSVYVQVSCLQISNKISEKTDEEFNKSKEESFSDFIKLENFVLKNLFLKYFNIDKIPTVVSMMNRLWFRF